MNYNSGKSIFIITAIIFVFIVSFFLFKMISLNEAVVPATNEVVNSSKKNDKIDNKINLDLLESSKFINLKGEGSGSSTFKAGRRNPFQPYE